MFNLRYEWQSQLYSKRWLNNYAGGDVKKIKNEMGMSVCSFPKRLCLIAHKHPARVLGRI